MDRFYVERGADLRSGARLRIGGGEAHHMRVKRVGPGDRVRLFDGGGREVEAEVRSLGRGGAEVEVIEEVRGAAAPAVAVTVGLAVPKGKRTQVFLEKATELGVAAVFPLVTSRTQGGAREAAGAVASERWRRTTIEAAKQSGALRLPELLAPRDLADVVEEARAGREEGAAALRLILDPSPAARPLREALARPRPERAIVLVGPEGGFEDAEVAAAAEAGFEPVRLGPTILRIETAAIAAVAAIVVAYEG